MGVPPREFLPGESRGSLGLTGHEVYEITGLQTRSPRRTRSVKADGKSFKVRVRVDTPEEMTYLRRGGILQYVLRQML
jgi:aconitate hydratase